MVTVSSTSLLVFGSVTTAATLLVQPPEPDEVIALFNDVYPGSTGQYNALKNEFAAANEAGCPLGNAGNSGNGNSGNSGNGNATSNPGANDQMLSSSGGHHSRPIQAPTTTSAV